MVLDPWSVKGSPFTVIRSHSVVIRGVLVCVSVVTESILSSIEGAVGSGVGVQGVVQGVVGEYFLDICDGEFGAEVDGLDASELAGVFGVAVGVVGVIAQERGSKEFVCNAVGGGEAYDLHGWAS